MHAKYGSCLHTGSPIVMSFYIHILTAYMKQKSVISQLKTEWTDIHVHQDADNKVFQWYCV